MSGDLSAESRPVVIRPPRPGDSSKLAAFISEAWGESGPDALGFAGAKPESVSEIASQEFLNRRLSSPVLMVVVAEEGQRVVGMATARRTGARDCEIVGIAVLRARSGMALDSRLARKALDLARKRRFLTVTARVPASDERRVSFYKAAGFTESGKVADRTRGSQIRILVKRLA
jgi:ribosomal protein S18 acetylase RimI-like enzyme